MHILMPIRGGMSSLVRARLGYEVSPVFMMASARWGSYTCHCLQEKRRSAARPRPSCSVKRITQNEISWILEMQGVYGIWERLLKLNDMALLRISRYSQRFNHDQLRSLQEAYREATLEVNHVCALHSTSSTAETRC